MDTEERRHLEMMAATIAAGIEAWGDGENFNEQQHIAARAVRRAREIQAIVAGLEAES